MWEEGNNFCSICNVYSLNWLNLSGKNYCWPSVKTELCKWEGKQGLKGGNENREKIEESGYIMCKYNFSLVNLIIVYS